MVAMSVSATPRSSVVGVEGHDAPAADRGWRRQRRVGAAVVGGVLLLVQRAAFMKFAGDGMSNLKGVFSLTRFT